MRVALLTASEITRAYFEAILYGRASLAAIDGEGEIPPCELLAVDLDTVALPRRMPVGCRILTFGSVGTPDLLRPFTDRELLLRLFPENDPERPPRLLNDPPRLALGNDMLSLSETEHRLLSLLLVGDEVPYGALLAGGWGDRGADENLLRVTVSHLRKKLSPYGLGIKSTRGAYRLTE